MKKIVAVLLTSSTALLAGCGGGGGGGGSDAGNVNAGSTLAPYVGTWQAPCDEHERQTMVVAAKADGSGAMELTSTTETYLKTGCSGTLLGTETMTAKITATPDGVADVLVKLTENGAASNVRIDKLNLSIPAYSFNVTGPGVQYVKKDGKQQWCIEYEGGSTCLLDEGTLPAQTIKGGIVLRDNTLYTFSHNGSSYVPDMLYVKK
ncbi:hypothetical protein JAB5_14010 [Janthinobacterium sp. HH103]|uniref:hypothetical protein n=1 Tax=unclassified Janthinobacterium TaxID=2610881 RepID=UPI000892EFF3|nr:MULTISPECIES: hypothetical protein [unclassified Janthinobacterium]OEZ64649.1 hypothetical protein JAB2_39700 [Janthinobacterium sp. HH100]OEZ84091.1 hypothetical protein JAB5_14010 [Janthinobacterium sp. HH103]QOU74906.1 hypothetical protein JAB4_043870 [Janthinobacterium sp. HH102]